MSEFEAERQQLVEQRDELLYAFRRLVETLDLVGGDLPALEWNRINESLLLARVAISRTGVPDHSVESQMQAYEAAERAATVRCCDHPESDHETYEYRGDKPRHCLIDGCDCKRFIAEHGL